jgi:hypothetical protein
VPLTDDFAVDADPSVEPVKRLDAAIVSMVELVELVERLDVWLDAAIVSMVSS